MEPGKFWIDFKEKHERLCVQQKAMLNDKQSAMEERLKELAEEREKVQKELEDLEKNAEKKNAQNTWINDKIERIIARDLDYQETLMQQIGDDAENDPIRAINMLTSSDEIKALLNRLEESVADTPSFAKSLDIPKSKGEIRQDILPSKETLASLPYRVRLRLALQLQPIWENLQSTTLRADHYEQMCTRLEQLADECEQKESKQVYTALLAIAQKHGPCAPAGYQNMINAPMHDASQEQINTPWPIRLYST